MNAEVKDLELQDSGPLKVPTSLLSSAVQDNHQPQMALSRRHFITRPWSDVFRPEFPTLFSTPAPKLRSTAYLDGLRGVAAMIVFTAHSIAWVADVERIQVGFGWHGEKSFITLPFVRVFLTGGHCAVAVFFVISGFVLTHRPITLIHRQSEDVYAALSSAVFRRAIRLYVPFILITTGFFTSWHVLRYETEWPKPQPTYFAEWAHWWSEFSHFVNPFKKPDDKWFSYDFPLWTIPVEFQGSILVFLTTLGFARLSSKARIWCTFALALYFFHIGIWQMWLFLHGAIIAELVVLQQRGRPSLAQDGTRSSPGTIILFIIAMFLASQPSGANFDVANQSPGWAFLTRLVPSTYRDAQWWRFWLAITAPLLVLSVTNLSSAKSLLESRIAQYLGRISFGLYLVHIPVNVTIGDIVYRIVGHVRPGTSVTRWDHWIDLPHIGPLGFTLPFVIPQLILLPLTLYVSEVTMKLIDEPSVVIGRHFYEALCEW